MTSTYGHKHTGSVTQNQKAVLANAYNELGKELSSSKIKVVGNYTLGKVIGEGAFGTVRIGTHRLTSTRVAIKQIPKAMSSSLTREIHHHRQLHHPHVTQMYEVIATESSVWIVTELCSGGELFDFLVEKGRLSEGETKIIFGQLCLAVAYLHEKGIVHRDLKLENVLLDEHCRVKLGDFGFTREFERGSLMETFCGTTGYASPEMLQGKKYQGPEVDVWSLGIILYCLLTGALPFDDDDEQAMREKIIIGEFEDPEWLSNDARSLIKGILVTDTTQRLTIAGILGHPWFSSKPLPPLPSIESPLSTLELGTETAPSTALAEMSEPRSSGERLSSSASLDSTRDFSSVPTTPDSDPFDVSYIPEKYRLHNSSEATITKPSIDLNVDKERPETVAEEDDTTVDDEQSGFNSRAPPMHTVRTPARTKRRSVSSQLSNPNSPTSERTPTMPAPQSSTDVDFVSLLSTPSPIIFSTPLERQVMNSLSSLGFDVGQIVYSVMSDACDSASALWWVLLKKAEKKSLDDTTPSPDVPKTRPRGYTKYRVSVSTQTDSVPVPIDIALGKSPMPQLTFVPATPIVSGRPSTPTRAPSPGTKSPLLTPSSFDPSKSHPSTPSGSVSSKGRKNRAGSVSIMQRATTALEAAGLVRKKSSEQIQQKERDKFRDPERKNSAKSQIDDTRSSGSSNSRPPPQPSTPPPRDILEPQPQIGSPWVIAGGASEAGLAIAAPTPSNSPANLMMPSKSEPLMAGKGARNRANFLNTFRLWLNDDKRGKRKDNTNSARYTRPTLSPSHSSYAPQSVKRRTSSGPVRVRAQRPSLSSRRSSSVNSRRSSIASVQMVVMESPQVTGRRSFTPNSEAGEYPSRPSSIRSFSMQRHRKSPSASSTGSQHFRTASPMQKYHRRGGSGSSTRVVRQVQNPRPAHHRSNSATSSIHSPVSSRPTSYIEYSESEGRAISPYKARRLSDSDSTPRRGYAFVAQKRNTPFQSPSVRGSSWKKSWGLEPPGWQTRTTHLPVEVISISPISEGTSLRDVFATRQSMTLGDESDWVDEDDEVPFAAGLGQVGILSPPSSSSTGIGRVDTAVTLSPAPRGHRSKRSKSAANQNAAGSRAKGGHSPVDRVSPLPSENVYEEGRGSRRQLPNVRGGPAFRQPIQEEDEEEE